MKTRQGIGTSQKTLKEKSKWHPQGLWPNTLRMTMRHILFDFFTERRGPIRILPVVANFLSILASINKDWISKFNTFFYALGETPFHTLKFLTPFLVFSLKLGFLGFKDNCINFFEPKNILSRRSASCKRLFLITLFFSLCFSCSKDACLYFFFLV